MEILGLKDLEDSAVKLAQKVRLVLVELQVKMVQLVQKAQLERKALAEHEVRLVLAELQAIRVYLDLMVQLVR
jgi:hypothetical protein